MGDADAMKRSDEEEAREEARDDALEGGGEAAQGDVCCAGLLGGAAEGAGARAKHSVLFALALLLQWVVRDYLDETLVNASPMLRDDCSGAPFQQVRSASSAPAYNATGNATPGLPRPGRR